MKLLSTNHKLLKLNRRRYLIAGVSLASASRGGMNVCRYSTPQCVTSCVLWETGRTVTESVRNAMLSRKRFLCDDPVGFERQLVGELAKHEYDARAADLIPGCRPNVGSDLDWSRLGGMFPGIRFWDYTKAYDRLWRRDWPSNYELTYSRSERSTVAQLGRVLRSGRNVAAVFSTRYHPQSGRIDDLPAEWKIGRTWHPVVDGDQHDVRLHDEDGYGVIVGLRFKGSLARRADAVAAGFAIGV